MGESAWLSPVAERLLRILRHQPLELVVEYGLLLEK